MSRSPEAADKIALPPHAYVPGRTDRHPEDLFDAIKATVSDDVPVSQLDRTQAWIAGMLYFDAGYFWECHEVLEAVWMRTPDPSPERAMTQAIIQLANARLKLQMERPRASLRLCDMVTGHLGQCGTAQTILGKRVQDLAQQVKETRNFAVKCNIMHYHP